MAKMLPKSFFDRKTLTVARDLLGNYLVRRVNGKIIREIITETEAYTGPHDRASHASRGKTKRTEVMFRGPGTLYVYFIYGMYEMLNVVTEKEDYPAAILIRATEHYKGPGILTRELKITRAQNGKPAAKKSGVWFEESSMRAKHIARTPRIGVSYAGPEWANKKYRFVLTSYRLD